MLVSQLTLVQMEELILVAFHVALVLVLQFTLGPLEQPFLVYLSSLVQGWLLLLLSPLAPLTLPASLARPSQLWIQISPL